MGTAGSYGKDFLQSFGERTEFLPIANDSLVFRNSKLAMIPLCTELGTEGLSRRCERLFRPAFTDNGVCLAFNAISPANFLADSNYRDSFRSIFGNDSRSTRDALKGNPSDGGISFYLDRQSFLRGDNLYSK